MMYDYQIPKPEFPLVARALAGLLAIGLIGLGTAAYTAFSYIGHWWQALAFALVVELCGIIEALAIMRGNRFAFPGLVISLAVSTSYNLTQAEQRAALMPTPLTWWQLAALAIGPMSAVFFVALSLGHEIRAHEAAIAAWATQRQAWLDDQAEREARRLERREARQERLALETSRQQVEGQIGLPRTSTPVRGNSIETSRRSYNDFVELLRSNGSHDWKNEELAQRFGVSTRTVTTWRAKYAQGNVEPTTSAHPWAQN